MSSQKRPRKPRTSSSAGTLPRSDLIAASIARTSEWFTKEADCTLKKHGESLQERGAFTRARCIPARGRYIPTRKELGRRDVFHQAPAAFEALRQLALHHERAQLLHHGATHRELLLLSLHIACRLA